MKNKWLTKLIIFVFLLSTFSNSVLIATPAYAEANDNNTVLIPDKVQTIEIQTDSEVMDSFFVKDAIILEKDNNKYIQIQGNKEHWIKDIRIDGQKTLRTDLDKDNNYWFQFELNDDELSKKRSFEVDVDADGAHKDNYEVSLWFDESTIEDLEATNYSIITKTNEETDDETTDPVEDESNDSEVGNGATEDVTDKEDPTDDKPENEGSVTEGETDNPENNPEDNEEGNNENESGESNESEEEAILEDGTYELSYKSEGVKLGSYYQDKVIVIVKDGKQYLQLQGKHSQQFIEYLYLDGKRMDLSPALDQQGSYITQIGLEESIEKKNKFTFTMIINAMGRIMNHQATITLDLVTLQKLDDDAYEIIEGIPTEENNNFEKHNDVYSFGYDSGDMDLSRYFEDTIDILYKNGKKYLEFKGTGMSTFVEALYVDGEKMAIKENDDGSYIAQIEYDKELDESFKFNMIINAMGNIMSHGTDVTLLVPDSTKTVTYTTEGADISRSYEPKAILLEKDGKEYIQLQGKSMRQFVEYLYIDGKKMDISSSLDKDGAYLAQFELPKPLEELSNEENKFTFDMVINASGTVMSHKTILTFDPESVKDTENLEHSLIKDTSTKNNSKIVESSNSEKVIFETVGANISKNYEDFITIVEKEGKQYLQLHGKSQHEFVDALFINGERMNIGEAQEGGAYLAQYELPNSLEENTYNFTMLINAMGRIMIHHTKIVMLPDGEYLIDYEALQQDTDKESTAGPYLQNPTKLTVEDGKYKVSLKVKDHETIKDIFIKDGKKFYQTDVESVNKDSNTRIVSFDIDSLKDVVNAKVKVHVKKIDYSSEQPFRMIFDLESLRDYDGSLEIDEEKPVDVVDGKYTINFRTLDKEEFEKVEVGKHLNPPANIELKDGKNIVSLTIDDEVKSFEIKQDDKYIEPEVVSTDKENKTRDVQFEISDLDDVVFAKLAVESEKQRSETTEHNVRLFFEGNSITPVDEDNEKEEPQDIVADAASKIKYQILQNDKDDPSSANGHFSGEAIILEYDDNKYAQITTKNKGAQYIEWLKNKVDGTFEDMVIVGEKDGERTYQFKLDGEISEEVALKMFIDAGVYKQEHDARLIFDASTEIEVDPKDYSLIASTNANGPNGENAQSPGEDPTDNGDEEITDNEDEEKDNEENSDPEPNPNPEPELVDTYTIGYKILDESKNNTSVANDYFTGKATLIDYKNDTYVQISTKDKSGNYIKSFQSELGGKYKDMLVVQNKNGDKTFQFKLDQPLAKLVALKMLISVPNIYTKDHEAFLQFDTKTLQEAKKDGILYQDPKGIQGPKSFGEAVEPIKDEETEQDKKPKTTGEKDNNGKEPELKGDIDPDKAFSIDYVIKQETSDEISVANDFFTGKAILLEKGKDTYAQITTQNQSAHFIDALRSQLNSNYVDMKVVENKNGDRTYQFKLDGTEIDPVLLDMVITVPGVYENQAHKARLFFDPSTKKEIDAAGYKIVGEGKDLDKPTFGKGGMGEGLAADGKAKESNPKTSDMTAIVFYTILLIIAGGVLVFQIRKNMVKE